MTKYRCCACHWEFDDEDISGEIAILDNSNEWESVTRFFPLCDECAASLQNVIRECDDKGENWLEALW